MSKNRLAIIGSGDLAKLITYHASLLNFKIVGYFDDFRDIGDAVDLDYPILGKISEIDKNSSSFDLLIIGIGYKHLEFRKKLYCKLSSKFQFANIVHASAIICDSVALGDGILILPGCVLDDGVVIKSNCVLNIGVTIAHDTSINSHTFIAPGVTMAGFITVGESCFIGINTTIIDNINICSMVHTGGGAVITNNIVESGLYLGIPAKKHLV